MMKPEERTALINYARGIDLNEELTISGIGLTLFKLVNYGIKTEEEISREIYLKYDVMIRADLIEEFALYTTWNGETIMNHFFVKDVVVAEDESKEDKFKIGLRLIK